MRAGIVVFPGSNCDRDVFSACEKMGVKAQYLWHKDSDIPSGLDLIILPGGFSYGDYLRSGAISAHSRILREVKAFAERGGYVLGICNGFQVLTESGLLPGALTRNKSRKFICKDATLQVHSNHPIFTSNYQSGEVIHLPVAHADGCYVADEQTIQMLEDEERIAFRYVRVDAENLLDDGAKTNADFNGSINGIAGIFNAQKNVLGLMPHPERACESATGGVDGAKMFQAFAA